MLRRWGTCGLVLVGQIVGFCCSVLLFFMPLGVLASSFPSLNSGPAFLVLAPIGIVGFPVGTSYWIVKGFTKCPRPLVVTTCSCFAALSVFAAVLAMTGGVQQAVGAVVTPLLVLLPVASVGGAYLAMLVPARNRERAA